MGNATTADELLRLLPTKTIECRMESIERMIRESKDCKSAAYLNNILSGLVEELVRRDIDDDHK